MDVSSNANPVDEELNYPVDNEIKAKSKRTKKNIDEEIEELRSNLAAAEERFAKAKEKRDKIASKLASKERSKIDADVEDLLAACKKAGKSLGDVTELIKNMKS